MSILLTTLLPALLPAVGDGVRGLIAKFTGGAGARPQNVDEAIKLMEADTNRLRALAELDKPEGPIASWVSNLRSSARYIAVFGILVTWMVATLGVLEVSEAAYIVTADLASSAFFYLFGDRVYVNLRSNAK